MNSRNTANPSRIPKIKVGDSMPLCLDLHVDLTVLEVLERPSSAPLYICRPLDKSGRRLIKDYDLAIEFDADCSITIDLALGTVGGRPVMMFAGSTVKEGFRFAASKRAAKRRG